MAAVINACAPGIDSNLAASLIKQESNFNPYAIGLDGKDVLTQQPHSFEEAVSTAQSLMRQGKTFSVGLAQIHISNVTRNRMTWEQAFDPCINLRTGQGILRQFYTTALRNGYQANDAVFAALRGYNSGNVHATVSNRYASSILQRVAQGPVAIPERITYRAGGSPVVVSALPAPRRNLSSPDMFADSTPAPSQPTAAATVTTTPTETRLSPQDRPAVVAVQSSTADTAGWKSADLFSQ
ncbi:TPA: transglycosylase SLT domain-containing protein [Burkholderia cepacia]